MAVSLQTDNPIEAPFLDLVSCKICLEILKKPVQCQRNEHYFCTLCITTHLQTTQTCPVCQEELTLETLRPSSRVVADLLTQFEAPRCKYIQRGCTKIIEQQELPFHHQVCGFSPVVCSNEGCGETVNKQDQASHEKERCPLRKTKCEVCKEEMVHRDHEKHSCVVRKELDEVKVCLVEISSCLKEIQAEMCEPIKNLQDPLRTASSSVIRQERRYVVNGQIVVAGGNDRAAVGSYEVFNWSTKSWTLFEDAFFFDHYYSFSFPYNNNIMICGGTRSNRMECLNMVNPSDSFVFPSCLPSTASGKGAVCGDQIITFGDSVSKTSLKTPYSSEVISAYDKGELRSFYGVESINESAVMVGGEIKQKDQYVGSSTDKVSLYNIATNELKQLAPLPYKVSHMATVPYKDNIIILGGQKYSSSLYNSVLMYNVTNQQCKKLPSMLEERSGCTAVIMGEVIVVMGGFTSIYTDEKRGDKALNTAEYFVLGGDTWKELPSMHNERIGATASVLV